MQKPTVDELMNDNMRMAFEICSNLISALETVQEYLPHETERTSTARLGLNVARQCVAEILNNRIMELAEQS